jgi:hypothetical protein
VQRTYQAAVFSVEVVKTFSLMYGIVKVDFGEAVGLCSFRQTAPS